MSLEPLKHFVESGSAQLFQSETASQGVFAPRLAAFSL
jgi:hypothetical protein